MCALKSLIVYAGMRKESSTCVCVFGWWVGGGVLGGVGGDAGGGKGWE